MLNTLINNIKSSINEVESQLSQSDFEEYCDSAFTVITLINKIKINETN